MTTAVIPVGATTANQVVQGAKPRRFLGIYNQSATIAVYVAFDQAAVAAPTAGQLTLQPAAATNVSSVVFIGEDTPSGAINIIASAAAPVTVIA
jgi:hypothetical protein